MTIDIPIAKISKTSNSWQIFGTKYYSCFSNNLK